METYIPKIKIKVKFDKNLTTSQLVKISSSLDAVEVFREIFNKDTFNWHEEMILLCLNNSNKVVGFYKISSGGITGTVVDVRMIFTIALKTLATSIMVAHNHPSGQLTPSESDKQITKKLKNAGDFLDIKLLDHLILTDTAYLSFADEGLL